MTIPLRARDQYNHWAPDRAELLAAVRSDLSAQGVPREMQEHLIEAVGKEGVTFENLVPWSDSYFVRNSWGDGHRAAFYHMADRVAQHGAASVAASGRPSLKDAEEVIRETETLMRLDYPEYQRNKQVQEDYYSALELAHAQSPPVPATGPSNEAASASRIKELEALASDTSSTYWRGDQAQALQSEFRDLLIGGSPAAPPAPASTPSDGGT
jgi:hypothetical protein